MSRVRAAFDRARDEGRAALVTYVTAGDPSLEAFPSIVEALAAGGADVIEVGVPFSDPTADGEVIQRASERALRAGATVRGVLEAVSLARRRTDVPFVLFGYANPFLRYGADLPADAKAAGADGFLVVDLPPEECAVLRDPAVALGLDWVPLVAPTTTPARAAMIAKVATSFVYLVSVAGVTGAGTVDLEAAATRAAALSKAHEKPVAVGFGVRSKDDVQTLAALGADGVVVGSAIIRRIESASGHDDRVESVRAFTAELRQATHRG